MAQTYNPYTGDYLTYGTTGGEWPFFLSSNPTVAPVSTPTTPSTPPVPSAAALQAALVQQLGSRSSNRGTGTQSGGPFAGQAPADVAQGYANANVAMKPSLMNSLRMATGITNPVSMLGQLGLSALLGMPGLSAFNVGGTEMPESDTAAIQAAAPTMPTSQVGLMTPMTDTLNSIRSGTFNGALGNFGQSDSGAANPLAGATSLGPNMPGVMQTQGGQLALSDPAAIAGMVAAGNTYSGNSGNAGQGGSGNQGGTGGGGGSNAGAGGGGSHKGERYGGRIHSLSIRRYDSGGDVTSADIQAQPIGGDLSTGAPTGSQFLSQLLGSFGGSGYLSPYVSQFLSGLVKGMPQKGNLTAGNPTATTAGSSASQGNQPYFPYTATTYGQGPAWAFFGQQNPLVAYAGGGEVEEQNPDLTPERLILPGPHLHAGEEARAAAEGYRHVPDALMGFGDPAKTFGGIPKAFGDQLYPWIQHVMVNLPNDPGGPWLDAVKGLNRAHALARAQRNWPDATIEPAGGEWQGYAEGGKTKGLDWTFADPQVAEAYDTPQAPYPALDLTQPGYLVGPAAHKGMATGGTSRDRALAHMRARLTGAPIHMDDGGPLPGDSDGQADKIPAMLSDGEYVWSAQDVADLGSGNNSAGAKKLDEMRRLVRERAGRKNVANIARPGHSPKSLLRAAGVRA